MLKKKAKQLLSDEYFLSNLAIKHQILSLLLIFLFSSVFGQQKQHVFINEFLAANVSIDADIVDFDDYSDWIEFYNADSFAVDLGGYFLTDNLNLPTRWQVPPNTIIPARGFLRFWADGYDDIPGKTYKRSYYPYDPFTTRYYHLNFKLSRATEVIGLFNPDSALVDSVSFGLQMRDVSMGRKPDGSENWLYFGEPTPQAANTTEALKNIAYAENPIIVPQSGFYPAGLQVTIQTNSPNSEIRYSLNGDRPGSASELYSNPITIDQTTVLRVRVFKKDELPGSIVTCTYLINENCSLPVISLSAFPKTLWDDTFGIYSNSYKEREIPVHIEFFQPDKNLAFAHDAGLRLTGQASLYYPQKSFTIEFAERYGVDELNYQLFPQRELNRFKTLYLRNAGVPDHRSTFFRDALQHTLVLNKMDVDCQAYRPVAIFLNGEYWGILNVRDKIDVNYLASIHKINPDDIDLLEYEYNPTPTVLSGNRDNYLEFYQYIQNTNFTIAENYQHLQTMMDIDEYINYQICEIYYDNVFWLDQNVRMWRERKTGGRWRWILFDTDYGFGMPNQISKGVSNNTLRYATSSNVDEPVIAPLWSTLIFRKLLANDEFKIKFIQRFASYMNSVFLPDTALAVINRLQNAISLEMPRHIARWRHGEWYYGYPISDYGAWLSNVQVMKNFARRRPEFQRQHLVDYFHLSGTSKVTLNSAGAEMGTVRVNQVESVCNSRTGIYFKNIPLELSAVPNVGYRFVKWQGATVEMQNPLLFVPDEDSLTISAIFEPVSVNTIPAVILSDTTFTRNHSPFYANGSIQVLPNTTLTLEEGVQILMPEHASILVNGNLLITGTKGNPVIFAPNEQSNSWGALCFVNATDSSVISNLKIIGATGGFNFSRDKAAISGFHSDVSLRNVTFENVQMPVFVQYGRVTIQNCYLHTETAGDLINVKYAEYAHVEDCEFRGNNGFDSDGIDFDGIGIGVIRGNRIYNIYGFNSDAIDLGEECKNILVENNIIYNISDKGVSIGGASTATVKRNLMINCGQGIGIKDFGSYGYVEHDTFYGNRIGVASFEKNIGHGGGSAEVVNCIFANSVNSSVFVDHLSSLDVSYSLSNTDALPGLHNIFSEISFLNNLRLPPSSPALDNGNPTFPADPDGSLPDLGAYPFDPQNQVNLIFTEIHYHPAEGEDFEFIEMMNGGVRSGNLNNFRISGTINYTFPDETILPGEYYLIVKNKNNFHGQNYKAWQWDSGGLPDGPGSIYLYDDSGNLIDFVNYDSRYWWPRQADGQGPSLELVHPLLENMVSSNWRCSYKNGGSPGKSNLSVVVSGIYLNEFLASNTNVYADENGEFDDWIEIYNAGDLPVNIGGLFVTDNLNVPCKYQIPFSSPELTAIPAKGFLLLSADGQPEQGILHTNFKLDKNGEQIGLVQITDHDTVFVDSLTYAAQTANISCARTPDGSQNWGFCQKPTPGKSNLISSADSGDSSLPMVFFLAQNFPNPFNPVTKIRFSIPQDSRVKIVAYDLLGRTVATLVDEDKKAGIYQAEFDATNLPCGLYLYRMQTEAPSTGLSRAESRGSGQAFVQTKKMLVIK